MNQTQRLAQNSIAVFFFFSVAEIEPRAFPIVGKCSATELHPQPLIYLLRLTFSFLFF
jgi:hypothetical protein